MGINAMSEEACCGREAANTHRLRALPDHAVQKRHGVIRCARYSRPPKQLLSEGHQGDLARGFELSLPCDFTLSPRRKDWSVAHNVVPIKGCTAGLAPPSVIPSH
jgi:hypothetical protein